MTRIGATMKDIEQSELETRVAELKVLQAVAQTWAGSDEFRRDDSALAHLNECVKELARSHGSVPRLQANINAEIEYLQSGHSVEAPADVEESKVWCTRTMKDVRAGDLIKPAGEEDHSATWVADRYWPVDPADAITARGKRSWHVVDGEKHWDDRLVREGDVCIKLSGVAEPMFMRADFPVDISLTPTEIAAIELLGWDNRERMTARKP